MVSFWPWKGDDTSAASFEKVLSSLSDKISKISTKNDRLQQNQRRYRVLWTLSTGFAYLIAALILTLVTGWRNWTTAEITGLAGAPVIIYGVRLAIETVYNYRIAGTQQQLNDLYKQREAAIDKLKAATKYNSTQQLLDKYGGSSPKPSPPTAGGARIAPPPTANIPGRNAQPSTAPSSPQARQQPFSAQSSPLRTNTLPHTQDDPSSPNEEFAPNAFSPSSPVFPLPPTSAAPVYAPEHARWYDRILDVVLGEDETQPKNRIVLICQHCRLVNGQAPPGTQSLEDLGKWRCSECGVMNGSESKTKMMMRHAQHVEQSREGEMQEKHLPNDSDAGKVKIEDQPDDEDEEEDPDGAGQGASVESLDGATGSDSPAESTRSKLRQRRKK